MVSRRETSPVVVRSARPLAGPGHCRLAGSSSHQLGVGSKLVVPIEVGSAENCVAEIYLMFPGVSDQGGTPGGAGAVASCCSSWIRHET